MLLLIVSSLSWRRKKRKEDFLGSVTWAIIHILVEHLHGLLWYEIWSKLMLARTLILSNSSHLSFAGWFQGSFEGKTYFRFS